jgi:hypothetical protein
MELALLGLCTLFLLVCAVQSIFINANLKELIILLCRVVNNQESKGRN